MPIYWLELNVKFKEPMDCEDEEDGKITYSKIYGYMQHLGATFPNEEELKAEIASLVYEDFDAANVDIVYDDIGIIPPHKLNKWIHEDTDMHLRLRSEPTNNGIWYRTGRGFYEDEE